MKESIQEPFEWKLPLDDSAEQLITYDIKITIHFFKNGVPKDTKCTICRKTIDTSIIPYHMTICNECRHMLTPMFYQYMTNAFRKSLETTF